MHLCTILLAGLGCLSSTSLAAHLTITIPPSPPLLPNPSAQLPPTTHATLLSSTTGTLRSARLSRQNSLTFSSLPADSYLLSIFTRDYAFPQYRVDVSDVVPSSSSSSGPSGQQQTETETTTAGETIEVVQTFRGNEWANKGAVMASGNGTLTVSLGPTARKDFYAARQGFSALSILKNPMILMGIFSAALVFGMPYLMENMDEETKKEFEEAQKSNPLTGGGSAEAAAAIQNFDFASWMAGGKSKTTTTTTEEKTGGGQSNKSLR